MKEAMFWGKIFANIYSRIDIYNIQRTFKIQQWKLSGENKCNLEIDKRHEQTFTEDDIQRH